MVRVAPFFDSRCRFGLQKPVKFYPDSLRFAGVIREKPILRKYRYYAEPIITLTTCYDYYYDVVTPVVKPQWLKT